MTHSVPTALSAVGMEWVMPGYGMGHARANAVDTESVTPGLLRVYRSGTINVSTVIWKFQNLVHMASGREGNL